MAKILIHTLVFPPDLNSNAYVLADLAREWKKYGHEITVLTTTPHYNTTEETSQKQPLVPFRGKWLYKSEFEGIPCYHIKVSEKKGGILSRITTAFRFHRLALHIARSKELECEIVVTQSPTILAGLVGSWIAKRNNAKSIYIVQDVFPDGFIHLANLKNRWLISLLHKIEHHVYAVTDAVTVISKGMYDLLRSRVSDNKILRVIPNFVDVDLYHQMPRHNAFSGEHCFDDCFLVSYVGNFGKAQNFSPVLEAAKQLKDLPIRFLLVGGGVMYEKLLTEKELNHLDSLKVLGYQPRDTTPLINAASDLSLVLLNQDVLSTAFPSKIYTLMASGKPILLCANPKSDVFQFVEETGIGWAIDINDNTAFTEKIRYLSQHPEELKRAAETGCQLVRDFYTLPIIAEKYHRLFQEPLADAPTPGEE